MPCCQVMTIRPSPMTVQSARRDEACGILTVALLCVGGCGCVSDRLLSGIARSVTARDRSQRTPLHWAAAAGDCGFVEILLAAGARADAVDADGLTPLDHALLHGQLRAAELLTSAGEDERPGATQDAACLESPGGPRRTHPDTPCA